MVATWGSGWDVVALCAWMGGPVDGAGAGAFPGLRSRCFFKRPVKPAWRAEKFWCPQYQCLMRGKEETRTEHTLGLVPLRTVFSVSKLDFVLFAIDDLHVFLCVSDIPSFAQRRGVSTV